MFGIIIWGSKGRKTTEAVGQFFCPQCRTTRGYEQKRLSKYFTLYFIPLFPTKKIAEYIECDVCHVSFKMDVLQLSGQSRAQEFVESLTAQLQAGQSAQAIVSALLGAGFSKEEASRTVFAAANGQLVVCNDCQFLGGVPVTWEH